MRSKKLFSIMTAGAMAMSLLGGCRNNSEQTDSQQTERTQTSDSQEKIMQADSTLEAAENDNAAADSKTIDTVGLLSPQVEGQLLLDNKTMLDKVIFVPSPEAVDVDYMYYDSLTSMKMALDTGEIRGMGVPSIVGKYLTSNSDEYNVSVALMDFTIPFVMGFAEDNTALKEKVDGALVELSADGTLNRIEETYIFEDSYKNIAPVAFEKFDEADTITIAVTGDMPPLDYVGEDGNPAGFNTALIAEIGKKLKVNVETINIELAARSSAITSGMADIVFWYYTVIPAVEYEEGKNTLQPEGIIFSKDYYTSSENVVLTKADTTKTEVKEDSANVKVAGILTLGNMDLEGKPPVDFILPRDLIVPGGSLPKDGSGIELKNYDSIAAMQLALESGEISIMNVPNIVGYYMIRHNDNLTANNAVLFNRTDYCMGLSEGYEKLRDKINAAINKLRQEGKLLALTMDNIYENMGEQVPVTFEKFDRADTLTVAVTGDLPPMDYVDAGGQPAGFNTALLAEIGKILRMNIEITVIDTGARTATLASGKADVVFWYRTNAQSKGGDNNYFKSDIPDGVILTDSYLQSRSIMGISVKQ